MQIAGKTPGALNGTCQNQQRPGMPSLMPSVASARHLVGSVSLCLPEKSQLPGLLVHTLCSEFLESWVVRPIATGIPASAWVAPHQLWFRQTTPWQIPVHSWGWGCGRVWRDAEDPVVNREEREIAETITAGDWGHGEALRGFVMV